jgi:hypothetical protein
MIDPFLDKIFISNAIGAALGRNKIYEPSCRDDNRHIFREELAKQLRIEATRYTGKVSDAEHCHAIARISDTVSKICQKFLLNGRLRYGTTQKSFNLYLKFLWRSGRIELPPHCPIDSVVLRAAAINGSWTKLDCERRYLKWINEIRQKAEAKRCTIAEWEHAVWLKRAADRGTAHEVDP